MPEDFDVQPPDVYEDNADAVQEPPASPKPCLLYTSKKPSSSMSVGSFYPVPVLLV